jgi:hypothetical protein
MECTTSGIDDTLLRSRNSTLDLWLDCNALEGVNFADALPFLLALRQNTHVTDVNLAIVRSPHAAETILAVSQIPNLQSLKVSSIFDCSGDFGLSLPTLTQALGQARRLEALSLDWIGILGDADNNTLREQHTALERTLESHPRLCEIVLTNFYFPSQTSPNDWIQADRFVRVILALPNLTTLRMDAVTRFYGRPLLTSTTIKLLFSHDCLQTILLKNICVWSTRCDPQVSKALRRNERLLELSLTSCYLASHGSVLAGLDENRSVRDLDVSDSSLLLEALSLGRALGMNRGLQKLTLCRSRLDVNPATHHDYALALLQALANHPTVKQFRMSNLYDCTLLAERPSFQSVEEVLQTALRVLESNHVLQELCLDGMCQDEPFWALSEAIRLRLGLNKAGFWGLSQTTSKASEWADALGAVRYDVGCLYHVLRDNPLLVATTAVSVK